jgi:hypothetical protein
MEDEDPKIGPLGAAAGVALVGVPLATAVVVGLPFLPFLAIPVALCMWLESKDDKSSKG